MTVIHPADIIRRYYDHAPEAWEILLQHSRKVTCRAVKIARDLQQKGLAVDLDFVAQAAMLHDIGIIKTDTPELGCFGDVPYLQHGILGRQMLEAEGLPRHALVCERHIGVGLTASEIKRQKLPLPPRDMQPQTLEEQIISYADLFYSKNKKNRNSEKKPDKVRKKLKKYGKSKIVIFDQWLLQFEPELVDGRSD